MGHGPCWVFGMLKGVQDHDACGRFDGVTRETKRNGGRMTMMMMMGGRENRLSLFKLHRLDMNIMMQFKCSDGVRQTQRFTTARCVCRHCPSLQRSNSFPILTITFSCSLCIWNIRLNQMLCANADRSWSQWSLYITVAYSVIKWFFTHYANHWYDTVSAHSGHN